MKTSQARVLASMVTAAALLFASIGVANATATQPSTITASQLTSANASADTNYAQYNATCVSSNNKQYSDAIHLINPYIKVEANRLVTDVPESIKAQIPSSVFENLMTSLEQTNLMIQEGKFSASAVAPRYGEDRDAGVNGISVQWWGVSLMMSNDVFNKLSKAVAAGGGAIFVAGLFVDSTGIGLPAGLTLDTLGGIIMAGVAIMQPCNWNERGVGLHHAWVGPPWCWPQ